MEAFITNLNFSINYNTLWLVLLGTAHFLGVLFSVDSIFRTQTVPGAIAWVLSLNFVPYFAIPFYLVFGRNRFYGYVNARQLKNIELNNFNRNLLTHIKSADPFIKANDSFDVAMSELAGMTLTRGNRVTLLINGRDTFNSIFEAIDNATDYILIQFYIVKADNLGNALKTRLIKKAREGVAVYFIYDEIGSYDLPSKYVDELSRNGIQINPFNTTRGRGNRFQLNFRNHRKTVVVDGKVAFVGGHNVGDQYLGLSPRFGHWRDTHVKVEGPAIQSIQLCFVEDWFWTASDVPSLSWEPTVYEDEGHVSLVLGSGPADDVETCGLFFLNAINRAEKRIWIASPYFIPNSYIVKALQLAVLKGVDVRIILPEKPDHLSVYLSSYSFVNEQDLSGVKFFAYQNGFMHQKVMLVDDMATIGTANFDNRSFRLNFEMMLLFLSPSFAKQVEQMFLADFEQCIRISREDYSKIAFRYKLVIRLARLMAPLQ